MGGGGGGGLRGVLWVVGWCGGGGAEVRKGTSGGGGRLWTGCVGSAADCGMGAHHTLCTRVHVCTVSTLSTLHIAPFILCAVHFAHCIVPSALHRMALHTAHHTQHIAKCTLCTVQCTQSSLHTAQCTFLTHCDLVTPFIWGFWGEAGSTLGPENKGWHPAWSHFLHLRPICDPP